MLCQHRDNDIARVEQHGFLLVRRNRPIARSRQPDPMRKKRRNGRVTTETSIIVASAKCTSIVANSFADATHASCCAEVERNKSNHVAFFARFEAADSAN